MGDPQQTENCIANSRHSFPLLEAATSCPPVMSRQPPHFRLLNSEEMSKFCSFDQYLILTDRDRGITLGMHRDFILTNTKAIKMTRSSFGIICVFPLFCKRHFPINRCSERFSVVVSVRSEQRRRKQTWVTFHSTDASRFAC